MNWVDLLIIGLMLLAAVHGLRLGALVQLMTFGGLWLGIVLGETVWVRALSFVHPPPSVSGSRWPRSWSPRPSWRSSAGWSGPTATAPSAVIHLGNVDAALGVVVAVAAVLLSAWFVAGLILSPNSRFTWLSSAVARSDILHSIDRVLPQVPSAFSELQTFLDNQGFPQVFNTLVQPSTGPVATPTSAATQALAEPAVLSTVKILGAACGEEQEGSGFVVGHGLVATNAHVVAGETATQVVVGNVPYRATVVLFDPDFDLAVLRTAAPLGPVARHRSRPGPARHPGGDTGLPRGRSADDRRGRRLGRDHRRWAGTSTTKVW